MNLTTFLKQSSIVAVIIIASALLNEFGHFVAAAYYGLSPNIIVTSAYIAVETTAGTLHQAQVITNWGVLANLFLACILFLYLAVRSKVISILHDEGCFYLIITVLINLFIAMMELLEPVFF
ncbi:hypothetical protein HZC30_03920 [Candidatus Woesearchaeota archaeon]|nr:hypothetical protein [Candidatus Woesearchaeota archaeon]